MVVHGTKGFILNHDYGRWLMNMNGSTNNNYHTKSYAVICFIHTMHTQTFDHAEMWITLIKHT